MNVVFMGSPEFAVVSLRAVASSSHRVLEVVTRPDRPTGRGRTLTASPVAREASSLGLAVSRPERFGAPEMTDHLRALAADVFVVVAFGAILRRRHLEMPRLGCVNVHPSLLPRHRGAVPIPATLLAGDDVTGVTTIRMDRGVDTGDILLQRAVEIDAGEDAGTLHDRLAVLGASLLVETLDRLEAGALGPIAQDEDRATHSTKLSKSDGAIDWHDDALSLFRRVRAMSPWPGAFTHRPGADDRPERLVVRRARVVDVVSGDAAPGTVVAIEPGGGPVIACGRGRLRVDRVTPEGGREMGGDELASGRRIRPGERWATRAP